MGKGAPEVASSMGLYGDRLALINQVEPDTPLNAGTLVKWVVGEPPP